MKTAGMNYFLGDGWGDEKLQTIVKQTCQQDFFMQVIYEKKTQPNKSKQPKLFSSDL